MFSYSYLFKRTGIIGLVLSLAGSVAGCGASSAEIQTEQWEIDESFNGTAVDFDPPIQIPGILTDQAGFEPGTDKALIFKGEGLPREFNICNSTTGEVVYTGEIVKSTYNEELDEYDSLGYFSDFDKEGTYHAYSDALGESYDFDIKEGIYRDLEDAACRKLFDEMEKEGGKRDVLKDSRIADALLLAYEMHGNAFTDDLGIRESGNGIPDIVDKAREEVEGLLSQGMSGDYSAYTAGEILCFAAILAKVSLVYAEYDPEFSENCLSEAKKAWEYYKTDDSLQSSTDEFYAAAQLYRVTGETAYSDVLMEYFQRDDFSTLFHSDDGIFMGAVTYLSIKGDTDMGICSMLMKELLNSSEEIAARASDSPYLVSDMGLEDGFEKMLSDMRNLTITDYIIYNHEYTTIIENHVHYLLGRNPEGVNFITKDTARGYEDAGKDYLLEDPVKNGLFIFMLSVLAAN